MTVVEKSSTNIVTFYMESLRYFSNSLPLSQACREMVTMHLNLEVFKPFYIITCQSSDMSIAVGLVGRYLSFLAGGFMFASD